MILLWVFLVAVVLGVVGWIRERSLRAPKTKFDLSLPPYVPLSEFKAENPEESTLEKAAAKYGDVFAVRIPLWTSFVFFVGPNASKIYHMIKEDDASLAHGYELFGNLAGQPKEYLNNNRPENVTLFTRAFTQERYSHFAKLMRSVTVDYFNNEWNQPYQEVDIFPHIYNMTLDVIIKSFLGSDLTKPEFTEFIQLVKELDTEERIKGVPDMLKNRLPQNQKQTAATWVRIKDICREVVKRRTANNTVSENSLEFIDFMIKNCQDAEGEVDYGFLATLVFGLIFAATSNNFATAAWLTFFTLSKPELMKPLIEEQQEYLEMAKDRNADLSHALINKFNFTDMAVKETIRLCSGGLAMRRAMQDFVIDNKYVIPKGWYLTLPHFTVVHSGQIYDKPFEFNPNRLQTEAKGLGEMPVFGAGRHPCIGAKFASMNIKTLVFNMLGQYDIGIPGPVENYIPKYQNFGVFRPAQPVMFKMQKKTAQI